MFSSYYNNLATVLKYQGDLRQAKEYHEPTLGIRDQTLGPQHPDVATSCNKVANVLSVEGELKEVKECNKLALGPQHPDVATSCNKLANVLSVEGELKEVKEYNKLALATSQQTLEP